MININKLKKIKSNFPVMIGKNALTKKDCKKLIDEIKNRLSNIEGKVIGIDGIRVENELGWFLIRASNTQNQLTCRAEALNKKDLATLISIIEEQLLLSGVDFKFNL